MRSSSPSPAVESHLPYRADIDGLRGIAVMAVVFHHAAPETVRSGFVGVDIFFVISGYLITSIILTQLHQGNWSLTRFYARRIRRIFPALILVLLATFVLGWWWMTPLDLKVLGKHIFAGTVFLSNLVFWKEAGYFDDASSVKPLLHLWSLAIEEQFYLVWPLALWALHRWRVNAIRCIFILMLVSWAYGMVLVRQDPNAAYYHPLGRSWELMVGALLAAMQAHQAGWRVLFQLPAAFNGSAPSIRAGPGTHSGIEQPLPGGSPYEHHLAGTSWNAHLLATLGLAMLVLAAVLIHTERKFPGGWAILPTVGAVLLVAAGPRAWINRWILARRPLVWVGLISYPLYLWHWPLMAFANMRAGGQAAGGTLFALASASLLLAWLTYLFIERPVRRRQVDRPRLTAALVVLLVCAGLLGVWTWYRNGLEMRYPTLVRGLTSHGGSEMITQGWRYHDCILEPRVQPSAYKDFCIETNRRPLVFLWGDSHASSLYPGFKALQDSGVYEFGIGERAGAICPPILGTNPRPMCLEQNASTIEAIRLNRPDIVILYAWWHHPRYDLRPLEHTVAELRKAGDARIIVLGAVPYWQKPLPQILLDAWQAGPFSQPPPLRLRTGLDPKLQEITAEMRARSQAMGVEFISGLDFFCNEDGCLTRINALADQPLSYDYGHLTTSAVVPYVQWLAAQIFDPSPTR